MVTPICIKKPVNLLAKFSAAKAPPKREANVIEICITERNWDGCSVSFESLRARLSPCAAIFANLLSFMDITAISAEAKIALINNKVNCRTIGPHNEPSSNNIKPPK